MVTFESIKPQKDWVLIEAIQTSEEVINGIIIPQNYQKFSNYARVLKVGPGRKNKKGILIPMELKVGDIVFVANLAKYENVKCEGMSERFLFLAAEPLIEGVVSNEGEG